MKTENFTEMLNRVSTLFCGAICLSCLFEDDCPLLAKYQPIVNVEAISDDNKLIVRCSCHVSKEKVSDNG